MEAEKEKKKLETDKKLKSYHALYQAIGQGTLKKGSTTDEIIQLFGKADDIFQSVSSESKFETWSYEKITSPEDKEELAPIRLYFNDNKLVSWNY